MVRYWKLFVFVHVPSVILFLLKVLLIETMSVFLNHRLVILFVCAFKLIWLEKRLKDLYWFRTIPYVQFELLILLASVCSWGYKLAREGERSHISSVGVCECAWEWSIPLARGFSFPFYRTRGKRWLHRERERMGKS